MNLTDSLRAAAKKDLAHWKNAEWSLVQAVLEWRAAGLSNAECIDRLSKHLADPNDVAYRSPIVGDSMRAVRDALSENPDAFDRLLPVFERQRATFRIDQDSLRKKKDRATHGGTLT